MHSLTQSDTRRAIDPPALLALVSRRLPNLRGKTVVGWKIMSRLASQGKLGGEWRLSLRDGTRFVLPRQSLMTWATAFLGSYDAEYRGLLARYIEPDTLVLDIGASVGLWAVPLGRCADAKHARVWAFEPHPGNHSWLHRNISLNGLERVVTVHETALGDEVGTVLMSGEAGSGGGSSAVAVNDDPDSIPTPVTTLDAIARSARVSVIKLDVEGYEIRVLRGAAQLIEQDRPVIFGEFDEIWLGLRGDDLGEFLEWMRGLGYDVFVLEHRRTRPWRSLDAIRLRPLARGELVGNLLFKPGR